MFTSGDSCPGCKTMKPIVEKVENVRVVDVREDHKEARNYSIRGGLPVFIKLVNGAFQERADGTMTPAHFINWASHP